MASKRETRSAAPADPKTGKRVTLERSRKELKGGKTLIRRTGRRAGIGGTIGLEA